MYCAMDTQSQFVCELTCAKFLTFPQYAIHLMIKIHPTKTDTFYCTSFVWETFLFSM